MRLRWLLALLPCLLMVRTCRHTSESPLRIATFNIEDFPKDARQVDGAFAEMTQLGASIIAVQEIGDPQLFARTTRARLGASWSFFSEPPTDHEPDHLLGVAWDSDKWRMRSWRIYDDTRIDGRNKATLEVRLRPFDGGAILRVLVVHFRAGTDGRETRVEQHAALARILESARESRDRIIVLGDFNATEEGDRASLRATASRTGLTWASEPLACTAFWRRADGCPRSRLDHVLTWTPPSRIEAAGACAREGCDAQPTCPLDATQISDHCPVVATF
jgi:endonuclease/exonuclease/phosphatase family metal-dependent hydrolase